MVISENQRTEPAFRMTAQRQALLDALRAAPGLLTADEVYRRVRAKLPRISLGTVYRSLEALAARGLIGRVELSGQPRRYRREPNRAAQAHLRCALCGRVLSLPFAQLDALKEEAQRLTGRAITGAKVEFTAECIGLCELEADGAGGLARHAVGAGG